MAIRAEEIDTVLGAVDIDRDRLLVLRHQHGDGRAFDELYRRYHSRLVAYCQRRVGDRHIAEELAQEAFVKALRAMPRFAGERRFYPWMTVIAQRLCIDHHRRSARVEPAAEIDAGSVDADHDAVFASVDRDHLGAALERLAPRHREILELREQRGWTYQQIAAHLDVPMTTVEALLHRARKALRREFLAVAGDGGRLAAFGGLGLTLVRVKRWLAALGPERLAPALGTAAIGVAAVGVVVGPLHGPEDAPERTRTTATVAASRSTPAATSIPASAAPATAIDVPAPAAPAPTTPATLAEPPSVDLGVATWYPGPEGDAYVDAVIECMPARIDVRPLANVGVDLDNLSPALGALAPDQPISERCP